MAYDAEGWTIVDQVPGQSRLVYVSSSVGLNTNDGLTELTPKQTIVAGKALMRDGFPDWILLKAGDTFSEGDIRIEKCGASVDAKHVWTSYGTGDRPILKTGRLWYGEGVKPCEHMAILGLHFYEPRNDPAAPEYTGGSQTRFGFQILAAASDDVLIEGCKFTYCSTQMQIQGGLTTLMDNVTIRRNIFQNGTEFGVQVNWCQNAIIEENIFDKNGWDKRTVQLHNIYLKESQYAIIRKNLLSRGGNMGIKHASDHAVMASDFTIEDNTFWRCMLGLGHSNPAGYYDPLVDFSHERGLVKDNVWMKVGKTIPYNSANTQAIGMNLENLLDTTFSGNIYAHNDEILSGGEIFKFEAGASERNENITATNNVVYNWLSTNKNSSGDYVLNEADVINFVETNNLVEGSTYSDPERTLTTYSQSIGGTANEEDFLTIACNMSKAAWDSRYTATAFNSYVRVGFDMEAAATFVVLMRVGTNYLILRNQ